ncbi:hypothetical protein PWT90_00863 [Aphanocladium album]|nr:hypothetical protein PWT90_00863 [Aphanocladium album]
MATESADYVADFAANEDNRNKLGNHSITNEDIKKFSQEHKSDTLGRPFTRYGVEVNLELRRLKLFKADARCNPETRKRLTSMEIEEKKALAHHFVRRRWKEFSAWNDVWKWEDKIKAGWKWKWQKRLLLDADGNLPIAGKALRECAGSNPGEYALNAKRRACGQMPESRWTSEDGDDFISSRPWFAFEIECIVSSMRNDVADGSPGQASQGSIVRDRWMEAGIWNSDWDLLSDAGMDLVAGWRWDHEDAEPPWLDLREINNMDELSLALSEKKSIAEPSASAFDILTDAQISVLETAETGTRSTSAKAAEGLAQDEENRNTKTETKGDEENRINEENKENIEPPRPTLRRSARIARLQEQRAIQAAEAAQAAQANQPASRTAPRRRRQPLVNLSSSERPKRGGKRKIFADITEDIAAANPRQAPAKKRRRRG